VDGVVVGSCGEACTDVVSSCSRGLSSSLKKPQRMSCLRGYPYACSRHHRNHHHLHHHHHHHHHHTIYDNNQGPSLSSTILIRSPSSAVKWVTWCAVGTGGSWGTVIIIIIFIIVIITNHDHHQESSPSNAIVISSPRLAGKWVMWWAVGTGCSWGSWSGGSWGWPWATADGDHSTLVSQVGFVNSCHPGGRLSVTSRSPLGVYIYLCVCFCTGGAGELGREGRGVVGREDRGNGRGQLPMEITALLSARSVLSILVTQVAGCQY
jgi:hypothetical protein